LEKTPCKQEANIGLDHEEVEAFLGKSQDQSGELFLVKRIGKQCSAANWVTIYDIPEKTLDMVDLSSLPVLPPKGEKRVLFLNTLDKLWTDYNLASSSLNLTEKSKVSSCIPEAERSQSGDAYQVAINRSLALQDFSVAFAVFSSEPSNNVGYALSLWL
jgi:hypothetical protein